MKSFTNSNIKSSHKIFNIKDILFIVLFFYSPLVAANLDCKPNQIDITQLSSEQLGKINFYNFEYAQGYQNYCYPGKNLVLEATEYIANHSNNPNQKLFYLIDRRNNYEKYGSTEFIKQAQTQIDNLIASNPSLKITKIQIEGLEKIAKSIFFLPNRIFLQMTNNFNLRMGELRNNTLSDGAWIRTNTSRGSGNGNIDYFALLQGGYDKKLFLNEANDYIGFLLEGGYNNGSAEGFKSNTGNFGMSVYNSYLFDEGLYVDSILKYIFSNTNANLNLNLDPGNSLSLNTSDMNSNMILLGNQIGYRYSRKDYYIEPSAEFIIGYIHTNNQTLNLNGIYATNNAYNVNANINHNFNFITKIGTILGKNINLNHFKANVQLELDYINQSSTQKVSFNTTSFITNKTISTYDSPQSNNMLNIGFGTNFFLSKNTRIYFNIQRSFFGIYNIDYDLNLGLRMNFGGKKASKKLKSSFDSEIKPFESKKEMLKNKKIIFVNRDLKNKCQGCSPESGIYFEIAITNQENQALQNFLQNYPYRIYSFEFQNKDGSIINAKRYLICPFKNINQAYENKIIADEIVQKIYGKDTLSIMYEVEFK